jgi:hypothetical protein
MLRRDEWGAGGTLLSLAFGHRTRSGTLSPVVIAGLDPAIHSVPLSNVKDLADRHDHSASL